MIPSVTISVYPLAPTFTCYVHIPQGYYVFKIVEGSPAEQCGQIKLGDKILEVSAVVTL